MNVILIAVLVLGIIALIASVVLYFCSKKFAVEEDPRLPAVLDSLPGANCGGCGYPGCSGLADALIKGANNGSIEGLMCPVGGQDCMSKIADILGIAAAESEPKVAVVRCAGCFAKRPRTIEYDGLRTCTAVHACGSGETGCGFGCLGCGDCVTACNFGAIAINPETGLPEVDEEKCTSCGACVKACPRNIIEIRPKGKVIKEIPHRVYVACVNKDKGGVAKKNCSAACIGCGKCQKVCKFDAIIIENNVAYIDTEKCKACGACARVCPSGAILTTWPLPVLKPKSDTPAASSANTKPTEKIADVQKPQLVAKVAPAFVPGKVPAIKPCEKPYPCPNGDAKVNIPAGVKPADINFLKTNA